MNEKAKKAKGNAKRIRHSPEEARQEILDAATEILSEHPFRDMTVARLMDRTSLKRPSFYVFFRDIYALAEALLKMIENVELVSAGPWFDGNGRPLEELKHALKGTIEVFVRYGPIVRSIAEAAPMDERLEGHWHDFVQVFVRATETRITKDQKAGYIFPIKAHETACALIYMNVAYLSDRFGRRPQADPETALDTLFGIWAHTLYESLIST